MPFDSTPRGAAFICEVCGLRREALKHNDWDFDRTEFTLAKEEGWSFDKLRGKYVAFCPEHAPASNY